MTIQPYSAKYCADVIALIHNFHKEAVGEYDNLFDVQTVIETIKTNEQSNLSSVFLLVINERCEGILFGTCFRSMINQHYVFQEIIWYVNEPFRKYGIRLLKEAEKMLKSNGVSIMIMAVLENSKTDKIKRFYERSGYKPMETHYVRNL